MRKFDFKFLSFATIVGSFWILAADDDVDDDVDDDPPTSKTSKMQILSFLSRSRFHFK